MPFGIIGDRLDREISLPESLLVALALSLLLVFWLYPMQFLIGNSAFFDNGDASQHVSGWLMFKEDIWRFPLLETKLLNYPEGSNIAFTDSIPIAAVIFKLFRGLLPQEFHYFGLWQGFAFVLQALAAVLVARAVSLKSLLSTVATVIFAIVSPVLLWRMGHTALMTHALILFSMANYLFFMDNKLSVRRSAIIQIGILQISLLTHPYFFAVNITFFICIIYYAIKNGMESFLFFAKYPFYLLLTTIFTMYVFGYLGKSTQGGGYGEYSFNLISFFCWGNFYFCNIDQTGGQGEGFSYLGTGIFILIITSILCGGRQILASLKRHGFMVCCLLGLFVYAASNKVYFYDHLLLTYPLPGLLQTITNTFRASGRFIWVPYYFIVIFSVFTVLKLNNRHIVLSIICIALVAQIADVSSMLKQIRSQAASPANPVPDRINQVVDASQIVMLFPPYGCGNVPIDFYILYQRVAATHGKPINTAYSARGIVDCEQKMTFIERSLAGDKSGDRLLVINGMYLDRANDGPADFINGFLKSNDCLLQNGNLLCFNARTIAEWLKRGYDGPFASSKFANSWRVYASYRARDLPTRIGKVEGDFLVSDKNQAGFLSYGPYISLPAGLYKVKIRYKSSSLSKPITGRWDIMSSSASGHSYHGEGELANTQDNVTEFQTLVEVEDFNKQDVFEVRLYVYQDVRFTLESLEILEYRDVVAPRIR